jgi:uncharacterized membrane protein YkoI
VIDAQADDALTIQLAKGLIMTRTITLLTCILLLLAIGGCAGGDSVSADSASNRDDKTVALGLTSSQKIEDDEVVTLEQCPAAVQDTIEAHLDGGSIIEIERTTDHGEVLYEVDVRGADGVLEFDVAADGAFRGYEGADDDGDDEEDEGDDEDGDDEGVDEEIPLSEVPDIVKDAAMNAVPGLVLEEAERETEGDTVVYELEGEAAGKEYEIEVSAAGEVLEIELDDDDDDDDDD